MERSKLYKLLEEGEFVYSNQPGEFAGWAPGKIFGSLACKSGMRMNKENRVFFRDLDAAVEEGYRPCKKCKPINENDFEKIKGKLGGIASIQAFYNKH